MFKVSAVDDRVMGKLFGFAPCCVDYYCAKKGTREIRMAKGLGGMRLCPACAERPLEEVIMGIHQRRICPTLFPTMPGEEHYDQIVSDARWTTDEREWLMVNKSRYLEATDPGIERVNRLHADLGRLEAEYAASVLQEPERKPYLHAVYEETKDRLVQEFMDANYHYLRGRLLEQQRNGAIPIQR